ncbi:glycosyl transferase, group 1 family protein [Flavobacterium limnosediminis JC2902]|uniref:Glycosyl transferase, group 1 family protein n=1 Tax=Flavobacterium limnosediminis JC2902 TaxID=1341181 RepID=V6SIE2_9FLAO|nr:glycosyltransferase [Flavobacterium limnosediminis]ESU26047.1 glycosyl transferase, group 1 family protein [Flavobacterium limnosediminis JC2902]
MRILQLIDSLEPGGAERMAVNYANALSDNIEFSGLVATRKEGELKGQLYSNVNYLFLDKKRRIDLPAVLRLRNFIKKNSIEIVHAHSSSFFIALLVKMVYPKLKIVWHDHYGNSEFLEKRKAMLLKIGSLFFYKIIVVNELLSTWALKNLRCKEVLFLPNFVLFAEDTVSIRLKGDKGKRILCLANLRPQKNHQMLVNVALKIKDKFPDWTFHLIGKDFQDDYSKALHKRIADEGLEKSFFIYGSSNGIASAIRQSEIAILTSLSEGLPVSLLEYGYFGLPVVATAVGEIPNFINEDNGFLVPSEDVLSFVGSLEKLILSSDLRDTIGGQLKKDIHLKYTNTAVINNYLKYIGNEK